MSEARGEIHLVLPEATERTACFRLLAAGAPRVVRSFASADDYLDTGAYLPGGLLLFHWEQPGATSGAGLLDRVAARTDIMTFVVARQLHLDETQHILRNRASGLLPVPLDPQLVRRTLDQALIVWQRGQQERGLRRAAAVRLASLTARERDILGAIAAGLGNKAIARQLAVSPRTVEAHRASIMRRTEARSLAELLRLHFVAESGGANLIHCGP